MASSSRGLGTFLRGLDPKRAACFENDRYCLRQGPGITQQKTRDILQPTSTLQLQEVATTGEPVELDGRKLLRCIYFTVVVAA